MNLAYIALLASIIASLAVAEEPNVDWDLDFARDGIIHDMSMMAFGEDWQNPGTAPMAATFLAGDVAFDLFDETLGTVQTRFGGTIQEKWSYGYHHTWLCYTAAGRRAWYLSDGDSETLAGGSMEWIVQEPSDPAFDAGYGCTEQPLALPRPARDVPGIGATRETLDAHFGSSPPAGTTFIAYQNRDETGQEVYRALHYRLKDGAVEAMSYSVWGAGE